jgi:hypothetical protein
MRELQREIDPISKAVVDREYPFSKVKWILSGHRHRFSRFETDVERSTSGVAGILIQGKSLGRMYSGSGRTLEENSDGWGYELERP